MSHRLLCGSWPAAAAELAGYETGAVIRHVGWRDRQACAGACGREDPVALQERIEVAICDLQLSCGYVPRLLIAGVPSVLPEACPLLVIALLRCLGRG
jgi:hypothetical protein